MGLLELTSGDFPYSMPVPKGEGRTGRTGWFISEKLYLIIPFSSLELSWPAGLSLC